MIEQRVFGKMPSGEQIDEYTLTNAKGLSLKVITYGGIVTQLHVPDQRGRLDDVVLGFDRLEPYLAGHPYFGCITGRVAGRVTGGKFSLGGKDYTLAINDPPNHLHGGRTGFDKRVWRVESVTEEKRGARLTLGYHSPDGEEGYPGNVRLKVSYQLAEANAFVVEYEAVTDRATPLNLTNHSYFNLAGAGNGEIDNHILMIAADDYAPTDEAMTLLGRRESVIGRTNDFRRARRIGDALPGLWQNHGDLYFIWPEEDFALAPAAVVHDPCSGREMTILSTEPCVQLYTGVALDGTLLGKGGRHYGRHAGFCLECQGYPNGVNEPQLGNIVLEPGATYRQTTVYEFSITRRKENLLWRNLQKRIKAVGQPSSRSSFPENMRSLTGKMPVPLRSAEISL
jgi:aldose 1-epimerase